MPAWLKEVPPTIFQRFFRTETVGGLVLLGFALTALAIANSPLSEVYYHLWEIPLTVGIAPHELSLSLREWINDGLIAVFFLLVGLEIKRELLAGELSSPRQAALPIACAIGGMVVPAIIYLIFNLRGPGTHGWGIPMATDIAFALGALNLIDPRAPIGAKVLLTALAIVDDLGSVLVITLFYSQGIVWSALFGAAVTLLVLIGFNMVGMSRLWPYLVVGVALWWFVHASGVNATIAGVLLAFTIPARSRINALEFSREARSLLERFDRTETGDLAVLTSKGQQETVFAIERASGSVTAPILRLEHALHNFSAFVVMPVRVCECGSRNWSIIAACRDWVGNIDGANVRQTTWNHDVCVARCEDGDCKTSSGGELEVVAWICMPCRNRVYDVTVYCHAGV